MTFKNFHSLAKKPEMYSRVGYSYFGSYDELLYFLGKDVDFFEKQVGRIRDGRVKEVAKNNLKIALEQIQFVNRCKNSEL